ncbi:unnamed protein product [Spirodela intermedia]|uniref:Uncharacterized protein n=1 Tax=Spirodela intermedia TaxID=51605 RepID=A0A7I8J9L0_SPIIN|nr:unnamed protein product [Spirodela intermedia]CAA6666908.1 unnamed protein product [Spirodela intermedia]
MTRTSRFLTYMPSLDSSDSPSPVYLPSCARELALARSSSTSCAAFTFSGRPPQVLRQETCHGLALWFMAFRFRVASTSDCPPERNCEKHHAAAAEEFVFTMMPGTAGGMRRRRRLRVYSATFSGVARSLHSAPGVTMLGLRRMPSKSTLFWAR